MQEYMVLMRFMLYIILSVNSNLQSIKEIKIFKRNFALFVPPILKQINKTLCICVIEVLSGPKLQLGMMVPGHSHWLTVCSYSA